MVARYKRKKRRYKGEDDYPRAFTPGVKSYVNKWQTKKHGKMHGTVPMR